MTTSTRWRTARALAMSLALFVTSACSLRSHAHTPEWPIAACPEPVTLPHPPLSVAVTLDGDTLRVTALSDESWAVLLPYLAGLRACAEQRGLTLDAVNAARP